MSWSSTPTLQLQDMVKFVGIIACLVIVLLDVIAGILAIRAEAAQNEEKHLTLWIFECNEPNHDSFVLAIVAATLLGVAHILANLLGGCCSCSQEDLQKASTSNQISAACLIFTWIILAISLCMLVMGITSNQKPTASCGFIHHHYLSIGGILCMVHGFFAVSYCATSLA